MCIDYKSSQFNVNTWFECRYNIIVDNKGDGINYIPDCIHVVRIVL